MEEQYVQCRFESKKSTDAENMIYHNTRYTNPNYIRDNMSHNRERNSIFIFDENNEFTQYELQARKKENQDDRLIRLEANRLMKQQLKDEIQNCKKESRNFREKKNAVVIDSIVTLSNSVNNMYENGEITKQELNEKFIETIRKMEKELDLKALNASIHYDEKTPHVHISFRNYQHGRGKSIQLKKMYKKSQDIVGEVWQELGFSRGISKNITNSTHLSVYEMHQEEIKDIQDQKLDFEKRLQLKKNEFYTLFDEIEKLDKDVVSNTQLINEIDKDIQKKSSEYNTLKTEYNTFLNSKNEIISKFRKVKEQTEKLENKSKELTEKTEKLENNFSTKVTKYNQIIKDLKEQYHNAKIHSNIKKPTQKIELDRFFGKKSIEAPEGYRFIKIDDAEKMISTQISIKKFENENNTDINTILNENQKIVKQVNDEKLKNRRLEQQLKENDEKYKKQMNETEKQFIKIIENKDEEISRKNTTIDKLINRFEKIKDMIKNRFNFDIDTLFKKDTEQSQSIHQSIHR